MLDWLFYWQNSNMTKMASNNVINPELIGSSRTWSKINPHFETFSMSCTKPTIKRCKIVATKLQASSYKFNKFAKNKKNNQLKWLPR